MGNKERSIINSIDTFLSRSGKEHSGSHDIPSLAAILTAYQMTGEKSLLGVTTSGIQRISDDFSSFDPLFLNLLLDTYLETGETNLHERLRRIVDKASQLTHFHPPSCSALLRASIVLGNEGFAKNMSETLLSIADGASPSPYNSLAYIDSYSLTGIPLFLHFGYRQIRDSLKALALHDLPAACEAMIRYDSTMTMNVLRPAAEEILAKIETGKLETSGLLPLMRIVSEPLTIIINWWDCGAPERLIRECAKVSYPLKNVVLRRKRGSGDGELTACIGSEKSAVVADFERVTRVLKEVIENARGRGEKNGMGTLLSLPGAFTSRKDKSESSILNSKKGASQDPESKESSRLEGEREVSALEKKDDLTGEESLGNWRRLPVIGSLIAFIISLIQVLRKSSE